MWGLPFLILASLMPETWRTRARIERDAVKLPGVLSGVLEAFAGVAWGVHAFTGYRHRFYEALGGEATTAGLMVFGATLYVGFLFFSWQGLLALYLTTEGLTRGVAAAIGEPCGSLVLFTADRVGALWRRRRADKALGALVVDQLRLHDGGAELFTCRERDWDELTTLRIDDVDHRVARHERRADPTRPHLYRLAKVPPGWLVRRLVVYTPEDVLEWTPPAYPRARGSSTRYSGGR